MVYTGIVVMCDMLLYTVYCLCSKVDHLDQEIHMGCYPEMEIIEESVISHKGMSVDRVVANLHPGGMTRVIWARSPMGLTVIEGHASPIFRCEYPTGTPGGQHIADMRCQREFDRFWGLGSQENNNAPEGS